MLINLLISKFTIKQIIIFTQKRWGKNFVLAYYCCKVQVRTTLLYVLKKRIVIIRHQVVLANTQIVQNKQCSSITLHVYYHIYNYISWYWLCDLQVYVYKFQLVNVYLFGYLLELYGFQPIECSSRYFSQVTTFTLSLMTVLTLFRTYCVIKWLIFNYLVTHPKIV